MNDYFEEHLADVAATLGYVFFVAEGAYQNLFDDIPAGDDRTYLFLDPPVGDVEYDGGFQTGYITYTGRMMLCCQSTIDQDYDGEVTGDKDAGKYRTHIKTKFTAAVNTLATEVACGKIHEIRKWSIMHAINMLDQNYDGVIINFTVYFDTNAANDS